MAVAEKLGNVSLDLTNQMLERSMLDEAVYKAYNSTVHLLLLLTLSAIREDLHARLG